MRHRVQLQALRAFETTARLGDVQNAANELDQNIRDVRDSIANLERQFGMRLFTISDTEATLTRAGHVLLPTARGAMEHRTALSGAGSAMRPLDMLLAASVALIWSSGFLFAKTAVDQFPPILLMCFRFTVTAAVLVWFVKPPPRHQMMMIFIIALISAAIQYSFTFTGLRDLDASIAIIVVQLEVPFGALLAAIVLKDVLGWHRALGMAIAFAGVACIAGEPRVQDNYTPMFLVIAGAFTWAIGQVMVKKLDAIGGFSLIAWVAVFASPQLLLSSLLFETGQWEAIKTAGWVVWAAVAYLGLVMTALGYGIWYRLLGLYDVNQVMPYLLLLPVFVVAGGVLVLGESVSGVVLLGGALAVAGVGIITTARLPR